MSELEILGLFCLLGIALFYPRLIVPILLGIILGQYWWIIFIPMAIFGFLIDMYVPPAVR